MFVYSPPAMFSAAQHQDYGQQVDTATSPAQHRGDQMSRDPRRQRRATHNSIGSER